jgi:hypothetical protein
VNVADVHVHVTVAQVEIQIHVFEKSFSNCLVTILVGEHR